MKKRLPKTIYVRWNDPGRGEELWLEATTNPQEFADVGETTTAATYELTANIEIVAPVTIRKRNK